MNFFFFHKDAKIPCVSLFFSEFCSVKIVAERRNRRLRWRAETRFWHYRARPPLTRHRDVNIVENAFMRRASDSMFRHDNFVDWIWMVFDRGSCHTAFTILSVLAVKCHLLASVCRSKAINAWIIAKEATEVYRRTMTNHDDHLEINFVTHLNRNGIAVG